MALRNMAGGTRTSAVNTTPSAAIGANVRAEMARRRVSQAALGKHLGLKQTSISMRLNGSVAFDINELVAIAEVLEVPVDTLLEGVAAA